MRKFLSLLAALALLWTMPACHAEAAQGGETEDLKMDVQIGSHRFAATLEDNPAVAEFVEMMKQGPVTVEMDDYAGFEKVGSLGTQLTASDEQTAAQPGDIVLYNSRNIVMFYGSNRWAYTRLGHIDDLTGWEAALGGGSVTAVFSLGEE